MEDLNISFEVLVVKEEELDEIYKVEIDSFPPDEAASFDDIKLRFEQAGKYFYCLKDNGNIIGFINGTCTNLDYVHHDSMSTHDINGKNLIIHSVTIKSDQRRKGYARYMLRNYISEINKLKTIENIFLLSKLYLFQFYQSCGFSFKSVSDVEHGKDTWIEMKLSMNEYNQVEQIQIDAFSDGPFTGNPAAVVFTQKDDQWMQNIAAENNLAETAYLSPIREAKYQPTFSLRWFTPTREIELCGHATLASAHALYQTKRVPTNKLIHFETKFSSLLTAKGKSDGSIELLFPSDPPTALDKSSSKVHLLLEALFIQPSDFIFVGQGKFDVIAEVDPKIFSNLKVDFHKVKELGGRGLIVTCLGGSRNFYGFDENKTLCDRRFDFVSRCFFPNAGIDEDPVTGSAHCCLALYWSNKLESNDLVGYQASKRGGVVKIQVKDEKVALSGFCETIMNTKIVV